MENLKNPLDVMKILEKSNCRECGLPSCMAFAAAIFSGGKKLADCPRLDEETLEKYGENVEQRETNDQKMAAIIKGMQGKVAAIDLEAAAKRIGAPFKDGWVYLYCLGKKFNVNTEGKIDTQIHVNPWIVPAVFDYILLSKGMAPRGEWMPFRDLAGGRTWQPMFGQRCEKPCKQVADANPDFFNDLVSIFNAKQVENHYESDVSMVLHPLPKLPMLICYWKPDGGLPSDLNLFFDSTAEDNLPVESIYRLGAGMVVMFEKIARNHGYL